MFYICTFMSNYKKIENVLYNYLIDEGDNMK